MKQKDECLRFTPRAEWNNGKNDILSRMKEESQNGEYAKNEYIDAVSDANLSRFEAVEIAEAGQAAARAALRKNARLALAAAMSTREEKSLREAVALADEASLDAQEFRSAVHLIEDMEANGEATGTAEVRRSRAIERLHHALEIRTKSELESAISEAEVAGLGSRNDRAILAQARLTLRMVSARQQAAKERRLSENMSTPR